MLGDVQKGEFPPPRQLDPSIDKALEAICLKAMALKPEDRYATPRALADDIEHWLADEPVTAYAEQPARAARSLAPSAPHLDLCGRRRAGRDLPGRDRRRRRRRRGQAPRKPASARRPRPISTWPEAPWKTT